MSIARIFSGFRNDKTQNRQSLNLEVLEDRMMLSSVEIFAAGATGQENLDLLIDGEVVQTFSYIGGDASTRDFRRLTFDTDQTITPGNVGIRFANDAFDPSIGLDRDLFVDRIVVDGVTVEAEDPSTFSTGIFADGGLTGPGFFQTERLNINGTLTFADPGSGGGGSGDRIQFDALGTTGEELVDLLVNGEVVQTFGFNLADPGVTQTFNFRSDDPNISIEDIRLEFVNDRFDPSRGIDRNVQIFEFRVIDGDTGAVEKASTFDSNVISSGIYVDGGITRGFGAGGFLVGDLNGNGFVEIADSVGDNGDRIEFDAFGSTGEEIIDVLVSGQTVASFELVNAGVTETFSFTSSDPNVTIEDIRLEFVNDLFDPVAGIDRNVQIFEFRVIDGDTGLVTTARTTDANVLNSGVFNSGTQTIVQEFGAGGFLVGESFEFEGAFVEVSSEVSGFLLSPDPTFQDSQDVGVGAIAVGPQDQIAATNSSFFDASPEVLFFDSDGALLSSVEIGELLGPQIGIVDPLFNVTDLEFFDDGSLVLVGSILPEGDSPLGPRETLVAKLNPDGTLDDSFSQQGILTGSDIQLNGFPTDQSVAIDPQGRVIVFGVSNESGIFGQQNFVVSRLQPDGSIDTTFGDNGSVFIPGFEEPIGPPSSSEPISVEVDDVGNITFGVRFEAVDPASGLPFPTIPSIALGRLLVSGAPDTTFGDSGIFTQSFADFSGVLPIGPLFEIAPSGVIGITATVEDAGTLVPGVTLLDPNGVPFAELVLNPNSEVGLASGSRTFPDELAVDEFGNFLVSFEVSAVDSPSPFDDDITVVQRILPTGEIDTAFGVGGTAIVGSSPGIGDLVFDSQNRLVVGGLDLNRFVI